MNRCAVYPRVTKYVGHRDKLLRNDARLMSRNMSVTVIEYYVMLRNSLDR